MPNSVQPLVLEPNLISRSYRGGSRLAKFRSLPIPEDETRPEDWIASTTTVYGELELGLSRLPDGRLLRDAIRTNPEAFLGDQHAGALGANPYVLVKVLDAQQRLSIHVHPSRAFARRYLGTRFGKTEAWYVLAAAPGAQIHLGFRHDIERQRLQAIVEAGQGESLLDSMHALAVGAGDAFFVPAGIPHAIGAGILLVEVQEPSDLLVRLETGGGYSFGSLPYELGLGWSKALEAVDCLGRSAAEIGALKTHVEFSQVAGVVDLLVPDSASFFRLEGAAVYNRVSLDPGYRILLCTRGKGEVFVGDHAWPLTEGIAMLLPWAAQPLQVAGDLNLILCRPPAVMNIPEEDLELAKSRSTPQS